MSGPLASWEKLPISTVPQISVGGFCLSFLPLGVNLNSAMLSPFKKHSCNEVHIPYVKGFRFKMEPEDRK